MIPNNRHLIVYKRIMNCVDVEESVKHQIVKNCARYSTLNKIKGRKFKITAVIKEKSTHIL